ncbi:MAG: hypothetical protein GXO15_03255 [Crenarchaeota archaeon]|nr:hypothetical protein [Thermoproteota archaeon]
MAGNRAARKGEALARANALLLPLLRVARRFSARVAALEGRPPRSLAKVYKTGDNRVHILLVELPASNPLLLAVYVSMQMTRPASPAQVDKRLKRLRRAVEKARRGVAAAADVVYVYLSTARLTRAAYRLARSQGALVALDPQRAASLLASHLARRRRRLLEKTRGRIWGALALLASMLGDMAYTLDPEAYQRQADGPLAGELLRHQHGLEQ